MKINEINSILANVKAKLEALDPANLAEQDMPNEQYPKKIAGTRKRLANLYGKLTKGRSDATKVHAYGAKRNGL
jgi:alkylhydroperoxidase/carboxymuconolactone decarboxylase family protein YurZ